MCNKIILVAKQVVLLLVFTMLYAESHGQPILPSVQNSYFHIDIDDDEPLYTPSPTLAREPMPLIFALKTNLLFDVMSIINVELEVPIGNQYSVAGEFIFPWWTQDNHRSNSRRNRFQLLLGTIEGRYWWGDRAQQDLLTGWFSGLYTGGGTYDIEHHAKGYQGDALFLIGVSGGYAHTINRARTLRLEYSLGVGYMTTFYRRYKAEFCSNNHWHAIEQYTGRYRWFGPTRARVSLSWLINTKIDR